MAFIIEEFAPVNSYVGTGFWTRDFVALTNIFLASDLKYIIFDSLAKRATVT